MPAVIYIAFDGTPYTVEVPVGHSLMQAAIDNSVPGILGDCGGNCSCATCHCYLDPIWSQQVPSAGEDEQSLLEMVLDPKAESRLACQIVMTAELEGLIVRLPQFQG